MGYFAGRVVCVGGYGGREGGGVFLHFKWEKEFSCGLSLIGAMAKPPAQIVSIGRLNGYLKGVVLFFEKGEEGFDGGCFGVQKAQFLEAFFKKFQEACCRRGGGFFEIEEAKGEGE